MDDDTLKAVVETGLDYLGKPDPHYLPITVRVVDSQDLPDSRLGGLFTPLYPSEIYLSTSIFNIPYMTVKALLHELHHLVEFNETGVASGDLTGEASGFADLVMKQEEMFGPENNYKFCQVCGLPLWPKISRKPGSKVVVYRKNSLHSDYQMPRSHLWHDTNAAHTRSRYRSWPYYETLPFPPRFF